MPDVTGKAAHVDALLTNVAIDFLNNPTDFIADKILPTLVVPKRSGIYFTYDKSSLRRVDTGRAAGAKAKISNYGLSQTSYGPVRSFALKNQVVDELGEEIGGTLAEKNATLHLMEQMMIDKEVALATAMQSTAIITQNTTLAGVDQWSDYANSDPFDDINVAKAAVKATSMKVPNTLVLGWEVYLKLQNHPDVMSRLNAIKTFATPDDLKVMFDVQNVIIAGTQYNSAREGAADSLGYIWGKNAWLLYINPQAAQDRQYITFGHTLRVEGKGDNGQFATKVTKWRTEGDDDESTWVRASWYYQQKLMSVACAYLIKNAIA